MYLDVGHGHNIHFETYGNPNGINILFLHGGPGLGFSDHDKTFFDPSKFHVVFIDQRGCGKSTPKGGLGYNTTQDLVSDINHVLEYSKIDSVIVFGGSWGATLAVLFAAACPHRVNKLILRGFFSATKETADIYLKGKIKDSHPESWARVISFVPQTKRDNVAEFYFDAINNQIDGYQVLSYEWARYGLSLSRKEITEEEIDQLLVKGKVDLDRIRIELHYALNAFFIPQGYVFEQAAKIKNIPVVIIHGSHDYLCPTADAQFLASKFVKPKLIIVDGGHSTSEISIKEALIYELGQV